MSSRLRKAINHQRLMAFHTATRRHEKYREYTAHFSNNKCESVPPSTKFDLPYPRIIQRVNLTSTETKSRINCTQPTNCSGKRVVSSSKPRPKRCRMMEEHCLWIRLFDEYSTLIFNHTNL